MEISAAYKITNAITGDFYIGSSKNVKKRWAYHKCQSVWKNYPNNPMYLDFQKYGLENFAFEILEVVEIDKRKEKEQHYIELLKPTYNQMNANGWDFERYKKSQKEYYKSDKGKETNRKASNKYHNQLCIYNGETLTLAALSMRFRKQGIPHPTIEAKKYLIKKELKTPIEFYDVYP